MSISQTLSSSRRHLARSMFFTAMLMVTMALLGALLAGCGGGDPEPAPEDGRPEVCKVNPEACK